jgi:phenylalanyl-tRNA synthetase beta subunit
MAGDDLAQVGRVARDLGGCSMPSEAFSLRFLPGRQGAILQDNQCGSGWRTL